MARRDATTHWTGNLHKGSGHVNLDSSSLGEFPVSFPHRTGDPDGQTSPEELIAAAHSSCLAMNFSGVLASEGLEATWIDVTAQVTLGKDDDGSLAITTVNLVLRAEVPGVEPDRFAELAAVAESTCPVTKALAGTSITLDATLA